MAGGVEERDRPVERWCGGDPRGNRVGSRPGGGPCGRVDGVGIALARSRVLSSGCALAARAKGRSRAADPNAASVMTSRRDKSTYASKNPPEASDRKP